MVPKLSKKAHKLQLGLYQHYKGGLYTLEEVAFHHESLEEWVVYRAEYGEKLLFLRPLEMFLEEVEINGVKQPRFLFVGEKETIV